MSRRNRTLLLSMVGVLVLALIGTGTWWFAAGRWTSVPAVTGLDEAGATQALTDSDLNAAVVRKPNDEVPLGTAIETDPAAGSSALRGDQIKLIISTGRPKVPEIRPGISVDEANAAITSAGLSPLPPDDGTAEFDDNVPEGAVLRLDPKTGTELSLGATVKVVLSKGPKPKPVPDVRGKSREEAFQILSQAGFEPYDEPAAFDRDIDAGKVIRTNPQAKTELKATDTKRIGVTLSNAISVPDLTQGNVAQAQATLAGLGLRAEVQQFGLGNPNGDVFAQSPDRGARVEPGGRVVIFALP